MSERGNKGFMGGSMKFGVGDELTGDEEVQGPLLPLRVLVVGDFVPRAPFNAGASAPDAPIRLDPAEFDELFARLRPRIAVEVPSVLHDGRAVRVDLSPTSLKSFRPDGLCAEVPLLRALMDGRLVLDRLRSGDTSPEQAQSELERLWSGSPFVREVLGLLPAKAGSAPAKAAPAPAPAPAPAADSSIDALLSMVDMPGASSAPAEVARYEAAEPAPAAVVPNKLSELITQVARSARGGGGIRPTEAVNRVEKAIGAQIGAILQHPEVRRLEQAWRGLKFLAERTKNHNGIRLDVISARPDEAAAALARGARATSNGEPPVSVAIVDLTVDGTPIAWSRLEAIAEAAEQFTIPTVVNGAPKLLGVDALAGVERLDNKGALFEAPHQAPWRSAAAKPAMRWVAIAMNEVLARPPYDGSTSRVREAKIRELPDDEGGFVWMAPVYAVASLVLASFRDTGWPCRIVGARTGGVVENLPVRELKGGWEGEEGIAIPTESFISTDTQRELSRSGVLVLASAPNSDAAVVMHAPTAYVPPAKMTYDSPTAAKQVRFDRASLVDQLFVARVVQFLRALCSKLPANADPTEVKPVIDGALRALFEDGAARTIEIDVDVTTEDGGSVVGLRLRPRRFFGVSIDEIGLQMPLG